MTGVRAAIVVVGDELLAGSHPDLNGPEAARRLLGAGVETARIEVVGDDEEAVAAAVEAAARAHRVVLVAGGLGPTLDDVTRHAVARAAGRPLVESPEAWETVRAFYAGREDRMTAANRRQALVPEGAEVLPNARGTAPGFRVQVAGADVFALPGPPGECGAMLEAEVLPRLERPAEGAAAQAHLHLFGLSESDFAERAAEWMERGADPLVGVSARGGALAVAVRGRGPGTMERVAARIAELRGRFGAFVFSDRDASVEEALGRELLDRRVSVALAESCTAGLATSLLASTPGISDVLGEAYVTYSNDAKARLLGVDRALLEKSGAVSREVAEAMARGAARSAGARAGVAITGVAGPGGGSAERPVGLVWVAAVLDGEVVSLRRVLPERLGRDAIRERAARWGLLLLLRQLRGEAPAAAD